MHLLKRQHYRCAITGLPLEDTSAIVIHRIVARQADGHDDWSNLCLVLKWRKQTCTTDSEVTSHWPR